MTTAARLTLVIIAALALSNYKLMSEKLSPCPMIYRPVCSTDGLVYSNDCVAGAAGKDILCTIEEPDKITGCTCELSISNITTDFEGAMNSTPSSNSTSLSLNETLSNDTISDAGLNSTLESNATALDGFVNGTADTNLIASLLDGNSTANLTTTLLDGNLTEADSNATLSGSDYGNSTGAELNTTLLNSTSLGINDTGKSKTTVMGASIQCAESRVFSCKCNTY